MFTLVVVSEKCLVYDFFVDLDNYLTWFMPLISHITVELFRQLCASIFFGDNLTICRVFLQIKKSKLWGGWQEQGVIYNWKTSYFQKTGELFSILIILRCIESMCRLSWKHANSLLLTSDWNSRLLSISSSLGVCSFMIMSSSINFS